VGQDEPVPSDDLSRRLDEVRWSTDGLLAALEAPRPPDWARQPSLLPGWSRGHLLTHLARNADAMARTLAGTRRGELVPMYDSEAQRDTDIAAGAGRDRAELAADVATSAARLEETWSALSAEDWRRDAAHRHGVQPAVRLISMRWREVEIHRADLDDGYGPGDWPASFVAPLLPALLDPDRIGPRLPSGLTVEVINTDSGQRWTVGGPPAPTRSRAVRASAPPPTRVVGPSWALVGWLTGRAASVRRELGNPPVLAPWA
jgi:maleylpyruvate isomerase